MGLSKLINDINNAVSKVDNRKYITILSLTSDGADIFVNGWMAIRLANFIVKNFKFKKVILRSNGSVYVEHGDDCLVFTEKHSKNSDSIELLIGLHSPYYQSDLED